jgi:competence protein ComEC
LPEKQTLRDAVDTVPYITAEDSPYSRQDIWTGRNMKRPLCLCALSLIAGIAAAYLANSIFLIILSILVLAFSAAVIYARFGRGLAMLVCLVLLYSLGALEYSYMDAANASKYADFSGKQVKIKGFVDSEPDIRDPKVSYYIRTAEIYSEGITYKISGRLLFTTIKKDDIRIYDYGRSIEITGTLNLPKGSRNPGGFNYRRYLAASRTAATVFALEDGVRTDTGNSQANVLVRTGLALRQSIVDTIGKSLPAEQAGLLSGMMIGYRDGLSKRVQAYFSDAGLSHIMAASGMNVAFIVLPLLFLFKKLHLGQRTANALTIAILIVFLFVTGFYLQY